jgi:CCR4-NOT transcription complex subunit 1
VLTSSSFTSFISLQLKHPQHASADSPPGLCVLVDVSDLASTLHAKASSGRQGEGASLSTFSLLAYRLDLIVFRCFRCLQSWPEYHNLLIALFKFLSPFLNAPKMSDASRMLFKGTMRILLALLHDFPDFLAEYYHSLIDAIPPHCAQLRNVILAAFPHSHSLPDPFSYDFVNGELDKHHIPVILSDYASILQSRDLCAALEDSSFSERSHPALLPALRSRISSVQSSGEVRYNIPFLNAVVLYAGAFAVSVTTNAEGLANFLFDPAAPVVRLFENLASDPDPEGTLRPLPAVSVE